MHRKKDIKIEVFRPVQDAKNIFSRLEERIKLLKFDTLVVRNHGAIRVYRLRNRHPTQLAQTVNRVLTDELNLKNSDYLAYFD